MWGRRSVNLGPKRFALLTFESRPRKNKSKKQKSKMFYTGHGDFHERTNGQNEANNSNSPGSENKNFNPFFECPRVEKNHNAK